MSMIQNLERLRIEGLRKLYREEERPSGRVLDEALRFVSIRGTG